MSELTNNSEKRKELLKYMILQLHKGEAPEELKKKLQELLKSITYDEVVKIEQELINQGLPAEEIREFCDIHTSVMKESIDQSGAKAAPPGHPVNTFKKENRELRRVSEEVQKLIDGFSAVRYDELRFYILRIRAGINELMDVDKHYLRKEYLVFPFIEKKGITDTPTVMWKKHDEIRANLKAAGKALSLPDIMKREKLKSVIDEVVMPVVEEITDMITREEEVLFPLCIDKLTREEWWEIYRQTMDYGYCLFDPQVEWKPEGVKAKKEEYEKGKPVKLSTGTFDVVEMNHLFKSLPVDITFIDKDDKVKFYSHGSNKVFARNRAVIGRDVRMCHPPSSVGIVEQILDDFKTGKESSASFWINFHGRFIYIEYKALRGERGEYMGTAEFTQDITELQKLKGEQRLLSYEKKSGF